MTEELLKQLISRLDVVTNLLLDIYIKKGITSNVAEKIRILADFGLNSGDIGRIIGKPTNYVTSNISRSKRRS